MTEELKSCPFCGGDADYSLIGQRNYFVCCLNCGAEGPWTLNQNKLKSAVGWNTRASPWRPIETVPYDQIVLMMTDSGHVYEEFVYDSSIGWHKSQGVTHWMPLPDHPEAKP